MGTRDGAVFRTSLDDGWVCTRPAGHFERITGQKPPATRVRLPHDAMRDAERSPDAPSGGSSAYHLPGVWRYLHTLHAPAGWAGRHVSLAFDGAYANAQVSVNGALVAQRPNGYARFHVEIGPHLVFGSDNEVRVDVRTTQDSRWYTGAGLYRGVVLTVADGVHLEADGVALTTPEVDDEFAAVEVVARVVNDTPAQRVVRVATTITDAAGAVGEGDVPVTVPPRASVVVRCRVWIERPHRWSPEDPHLYGATVRVHAGGETLDELLVPFGVRVVQVDPFRGLRINGVPTKLRGACIHHDNGVLGAASHPDAEERKVERLKAAGFNAVRMSHNPASQALLDACDRLGMLVMNEAFDTWRQHKSPLDYALHFDRWWAADLEAMVAGSINHPSVILYSIGNEIPELGRPDGRVTGRALAEKVRALDPTRPVTNGLQILFLVDLDAQMEAAGGLNQFMGGLLDRTADGGQGFAAGQNVIATTGRADANIEEACSVLDVVGYNYAEARYGHDAQHFPQRVSVGSETFPTRIAHNWEQVMAHDAVLGDFTWTGLDYLGEAGIGGHAYAEDGATFPYGLGYPNLTARCGDLDLLGERLPISFYRGIVFGLREQPYLAVGRPERHGHTIPAPNAWQWSDTVSSWTWPGFEGRPIAIEAYARADEVEFFLDGSSLGRVPVGGTRALIASLETTYAPGELVAVAHRAGVEVGRVALVTAGEVATVALRPDRGQLRADGGLAFVLAELVDAAGVRNAAADQRIEVAVEGPGELVGLGGGNWRTEERFDASWCTTYDGRALGVLRATGPGEIRVRVTGDGVSGEAELVAR